jgi:flagellar basal body-associated protein FliL
MSDEEDKKETLDADKKGTKKDILLVLSIVIIIAVIIFILSFNLFKKESVPTVEYNNFVFSKLDGVLWYWQWQDGKDLYTIPMRYTPYEVEHIIIEGNLNESFNNYREVYITFDPRSNNFTSLTLAAAELTQSMATALRVKPIAACTRNETDTCAQRPIITCENTYKPVIYLKEDPVTKLVLKGNCIVAQGSGVELLRGVDRLLYNWYGIMD